MICVGVIWNNEHVIKMWIQSGPYRIMGPRYTEWTGQYFMCSPTIHKYHLRNQNSMHDPCLSRELQTYTPKYDRLLYSFNKKFMHLEWTISFSHFGNNIFMMSSKDIEWYFPHSTVEWSLPLWKTEICWGIL